MTYGVPYSFVPGTKAKADEVNANFNDLLDKIETTNTRIDDANSLAQTNLESINTKIDETQQNCANLDLSNLSSTGKALFNAKANSTLLDGTWVIKKLDLCTSKSIATNTKHTFSLSSYLPADSSKYQVLFSVATELAEKSGSNLALYVSTDWMTSTFPIVRQYSYHSGYMPSAGTATVLVSTGRKLYFSNSAYAVNNSVYTVRLLAYRKVR